MSSGCGPAAPTSTAPGTTPPSGTTSAGPTGTPALGIDFRVPPTRAPSAVVSPLAMASVSVADDGRSISLQVGQRLLVNLGEEFDWTVQVGDPSIISRVPNITLVRGVQGVYQANRVGQTALTANGDPACRKAQPACPQPARALQVQISVT
jgi:hypothetical protein